MHLHAEDAARPDAAVLARFRGLLVAARFAMLESYMLLFLLAPLMPEIMKRVGFGTAAAARAAGVLDVARLSCFVGLFAYQRLARQERRRFSAAIARLAHRLRARAPRSERASRRDR